MVNHEFDQVIVLEIWVISEVFEDVLHSNVAIIVAIQGQKSFSHTFVAICKLLFQFWFKFQKTLFYNLLLVLRGEFLSISNLSSFQILKVVHWVLHEVKMWEEVFLETVEVYSWLLTIEKIKLLEVSLNLIYGKWNPIFNNNVV